MQVGVLSGAVKPSVTWAGVFADPLDVSEDPWGNLTSGASTGGYAYTGREWEPEISLYYYRARYYDPKAGRFISEDPIGFASGDVNFYAYVWNNALGWIDPFGLDSYRVNRRLGLDQGLPPGAVLSHTYVVTTNPDGSIESTYSWGNKANTRGWNKDQPEDRKAAEEALKNK